jgi:hypothetical protein
MALTGLPQLLHFLVYAIGLLSLEGVTRRERAQVLAEARSRSVIHSRPYHRAASTSPSMKAASTSGA